MEELLKCISLIFHFMFTSRQKDISRFRSLSNPSKIIKRTLLQTAGKNWPSVLRLREWVINILDTPEGWNQLPINGLSIKQKIREETVSRERLRDKLHIFEWTSESWNPKANKSQISSHLLIDRSVWERE